MTAPLSASAFDRDAFARRLAELFGGASSEDELRDRLAAPWQRELLWRCALAPRFDRETVVAVLAVGLDTDRSAAALHEWLATHAEVEVTAPPTLALAMRDGPRAARLTLPPTPPVTAAIAGRFRDMAARLAAHYQARGADWALDELCVLAVADPGRALRSARREFEHASKAADFTRCFQLVRVLESRAALLGALGHGHFPDAGAYRDLGRGIEELRRRYDSARAFSGDFERTAQVLERQVMRDAWHWILPPRAAPRSAARDHTRHREWMLDVEASGGSGKTAFLRWLSSRRCLPAGVPYGRLDFDFVDPRLTAVAPWYLLAQLARVLDPQLPGRPLLGVVARADDVVDIGRFALGPSEAAQALHQLRSPVALEVAAPVVSDFAAALNGARMPAIVVVLDTLEVALLDPEADLLTFLQLLAVVHDNCPSLKVVLSGRFNLGRRLAGFTEMFEEPGHARKVALEKMSHDESIDYLVRLRHLPVDPTTRAIAKRCGGLPFALSLFADERQINPKMTVREVREIPGPELHYLVERVLRRIPRQIAWLLRYSVVAPRLTRTFLAEVIVPELEAMRKGAAHDHPMRDPIIAAFYDDAGTALGADELSADRLWDELERHASAFSFVSRDESTEGALKLHDEVLRPMRRELARHRVKRRLHRAAMVLAAKKAGALAPGRESDWVAQQKDALYHALRLSPLQGRRCWERLNALALRRSAHEARCLLANEVLAEDVDVPAGLRIAAAREKTEARIALAEQFGATHAHHWDEGARALAQWRQLLPPARRARDGRLIVAQERLAARGGAATAASVRRLQRLLRGRRDVSERLELHAALARGVTGSPAARRHVEAALGLLATGKARWPAGKRVHFLLNASDEYIRQGDYSKALRVTTAVVLGGAQLPPAERAEALARQVWLLTTCGLTHRLEAARTRAAALDAQLVPDASQASERAVVARCLLRQELARAMIEGGPPCPPPLAGSPLPPTAHALDLKTDAEVAAARADAARALECIGRARELTPPEDPELAASLFLLAEVTTCDVLGDMRQARSALLAALAMTMREGSDAWWDARLAQCIHGERSDHALTQMRARNKRFPAPWSEMVAALGALAAARALPPSKRTRVRRQATAELTAALTRITPVAARRRLLFRRLPDVRLVSIDGLARDRLAAALDVKPPADPAADPAWVEYLAVKAFTHFRAADAHVMRTAAGVARCLSVVGDDGAAVTCDADALASEERPLTRGIAAYARARHLSRQGDSAGAIALVQQARELVSGPDVPPSVWSARADLLLYRLTASTNPAAGALLLSAEETCEHLGSALGAADVQLARQLTPAEAAAGPREATFVALTLDAATWHRRDRLSRAVAADLATAGTRRTPERVIAEVSRDFSAALRACRSLLPAVGGAPGRTLRAVLVARDPVTAALPWELAIRQMAASTRRPTAGVLTAGWRHDKEPRSGVNERWLPRAYRQLEVTAPTHDLAALTRAFQARQALPVTGTVDPATLRRIVRALRGDRNPRVAVVLTAPDYGPTTVVEHIYRDQPADLSIARGTSGEVLKQLHGELFDVVHVVAPIVESASFGGIAFDLAAGSRRRAASGRTILSLSELSGVLKRPESLLRPIIVVHNTLEKLPVREVIRQYALRNIAAMELSRSGTPVATVAVSSTWFGTSEGGLYPVIESILGGQPLVTVIDALNARRHPDGTPLRPRARLSGAAAIARELMLFGTCIYASNPEFIAV